MESRRKKFQKKLESYKTDGIKSVYYAPPEKIKMEYPSIVYTKEMNQVDTANDSRYFNYSKYQLMILDKNIENPVIDKILDDFNTAIYINEFWADGIHTTIIELYY